MNAPLCDTSNSGWNVQRSTSPSLGLRGANCPEGHLMTHIKHPPRTNQPRARRELLRSTMWGTSVSHRSESTTIEYSMGMDLHVSTQRG